jgi:ABC-type multidrug transport system ATPase subunit
MPVVVEVENLGKKFGEFTAVDDLSFTVNQGDVYGFLGQNGAGKSTTIRMMLSLIRPTTGSIRIFGQELASARTGILRKTGAVIERPDLYKYLTAIDNLSVFARLSGIRLTRQQLLAKLSQVGLAERADSKVRTFSQGMKQRLGIAVALVHDPELVILDEPTNGLDPQGIADMRNLIISLSRDQGKTVIVSSHLLSEMEQMATRMIIIDRGRKIVEGDMKELLDPTHVLLHVETTDPEATGRWIAGSSWSNIERQLLGPSWRLRMNRSDIASFTRDLAGSGIDIIAVSPRNSLEEYFLSITGGEKYAGTDKDRIIQGIS